MEQQPDSDFDRLTEHLNEVQRLLSRHRLVENLVNRQEMPKHGLVESSCTGSTSANCGQLLNRLDAVDAARILEALCREDRLLAWEQIKVDRLDGILLLLTGRCARGTAQRLASTRARRSRSTPSSCTTAGCAR